MAEIQEKTVEFYSKENGALKQLVLESEKASSDLKTELETYTSFISKEDFADVEKSLEAVVAYSELGSVESIKASLEKLAAYEEAATLEEIDTATETLAAYKEAATLEEIATAIATIEAYTSTGLSADEVKEIVETKQKLEFDAAITSMTEKFSVSEKAAIATLDLFAGNFESASEYLTTLKSATAPVSTVEATPVVATVERTDPVIGTVVTVTESTKTTTVGKKLTMLGDM